MAAGHALPDKVRKGDAKRDRGNRTGFSTGAISAAAAAAATLGLVQGEVPDAVECVLPNTMRVHFKITDGRVDGAGTDHFAGLQILSHEEVEAITLTCRFVREGLGRGIYLALQQFIVDRQ